MAPRFYRDPYPPSLTKAEPHSPYERVPLANTLDPKLPKPSLQYSLPFLYGPPPLSHSFPTLPPLLYVGSLLGVLPLLGVDTSVDRDPLGT